MLRRLGPLGKTALGSMLASFASQAAIAISGVLAARLLGPENRGYLALLVLLPTILILVGDLGVPAAIPYFLAKTKGSERTFLGSLRIPAALQAIGLFAAHVVVLSVFLIGKPNNVRLAAVMTIFVLPCGLTLEYALSTLQGLHRFTAFSLLRISPVVVYAGGIVTLATLHLSALWSIALVWSGSYLITSIAAIVTAAWSIPSVISSEPSPRIMTILTFGVRGLLGSVSPVETFRLDQALVGLALSPASLGLYAVAVSFSNLPRFIGQSLGMVLYPHVARQATAAQAWKSLWRFFLLSLGTAVVVVVAVESVLNVILPLLFGAEFTGAISVTRILIVAGLFLGLRRVLADGARGAGYPGAGTVAELVAWAVLIPALWALTTRLGLIGVATAFAAAAGSGMLFLVGYLLQKTVVAARVGTASAHSSAIAGQTVA